MLGPVQIGISPTQSGSRVGSSPPPTSKATPGPVVSRPRRRPGRALGRKSPPRRHRRRGRAADQGRAEVSKSEWKGQVTLPKGGRARRVPMTKKLAAVLQAHRHLRGPRVLYRDNATSTSKQTLSTWMISAQRRAGLKATGNKHRPKHTFCSHLAMRGATLIAIKELAGHRSIRATMRYMHLSPSHKEKAIELLDQARSEEGFGVGGAPQIRDARGRPPEALWWQLAQIVGAASPGWQWLAASVRSPSGSAIAAPRRARIPCRFMLPRLNHYFW